MTIPKDEFKAQASLWLMFGLATMGLVVMLPDKSYPHLFAFLVLAPKSPWANLWDWASAWYSLKVILLAIGLFMVIEAIGTLLARKRLRALATFIFIGQVPTVLLFLAGMFWLFKSLF